MSRPRIAIVVGSTRPGRFADHPARWIKTLGDARDDLDFEIVDLRDYPMALFDEAASPAWGETGDEAARRWQAKVAEFDGFIFTAAEYNHGPTAVLKNAIDYVHGGWINKPAAFVGYGGVGGARAVEQLRLIAVEMQMAPIRNALHIMWPVVTAVKEGKSFDEFEFLVDGARAMLDQLGWWTKALKAARAGDERVSKAA